MGERGVDPVDGAGGANDGQHLAAAQEALARRQLLRGLGGVALGVGAAAALSRPAAAATTPAMVGTYWQEGGQVFNARAYGAKGDGSTDDTRALAATIAAAAAAGGGIVFLPQGTYVVSAALPVATGGINIIGAGAAATKIHVASSYPNGDVFVFANVSYCSVRMLSIQASAPRTGGAAIHETTANAIYVQDVEMNNQYVGCWIDGTCILNYIDRGYWTNFSPDGVGIWIDTDGNDQYISNIVMGHIGNSQLPLANLRIQRSGAVWAQTSDFLHGQNGLLIDPDADEVTWLFFSDCAFDSCAQYCIKIDPAPSATVRGVNFVNCWSSSCLNGDGCYIAGPTHGVEFTAHRFLNNRGNGLTVHGPANSVYVDNSLVAGNSRGQPQVASGIVFTDGASGFAVRNTRSGQGINFPNTQRWGLQMAAGTNTYVVTGNDFHLNGVPGNGGTVSDGGTNKVVANNLTSPEYNP